MMTSVFAQRGKHAVSLAGSMPFALQETPVVRVELVVFGQENAPSCPAQMVIRSAWSDRRS